MEVVDDDLLLERDEALRVQILRLLKQQFVCLDRVLLHALRQLLVNFDLLVGLFDGYGFPIGQISD